ncbi:MAG: heme-binding protein [Planctomycetaceae bacterium]|nr:heme-binding protein [Planctomycetaceae bacterium]
MAWLFRRAGSKDHEVRTRTEPALGRAETLQPRLCLGGVTSPATGPSEPSTPPSAFLDEAISAEVDFFSPNGDDTPASAPSDTSGPTAGDESAETTSMKSVATSDDEPDTGSSDFGTGFQEGAWSNVSLVDGPAETDSTHDNAAPNQRTTMAAPSSSPAGTSGGEGSGSGATESSASPDDVTAGIPNESAPVGSSASANSSGGMYASGPGASNFTADTLAMMGFTLDENGNAIATPGADRGTPGAAWWQSAEEPVVIRYDFRDIDGATNQITAEQQAVVEVSLQAWSDATGGKVVFEHSTTAADDQIVNIGVGNLAPFGRNSGKEGTLSVGGSQILEQEDGSHLVRGVAWMDAGETWDNAIGNGNPQATVDFFTAVSHEMGHVLGYEDVNVSSDGDMMRMTYSSERNADAIQFTVANSEAYLDDVGAIQAFSVTDLDVDPLLLPGAQLTASEVANILSRASTATQSEDAIIAIVDRNGRILGVRVEANVLATIVDPATLVFAIDGAVAKARTAAFFSSDAAALTTRTIQYISQSTVTQREVESNPNVDNASQATADASTVRGPGFVAPIGLGGHFPPGVAHTPPVDLFGIEHTNRDSIIAPGADGVKGTADDFELRTSLDGMGRQIGRFNIDPAFVPAGQGLFAPESYGTAQNSGILPDATSRGIATLPGGIPLYRDTNGDGLGDHLIGGVGVFFPGADGYATHEQGFIPGIGQSQEQRVQNSRLLEAEFIALVAAGGSITAQSAGIPGASVSNPEHLDVPLTRIDLVGITLPAVGNVPGRLGVEQLLQFGALISGGSDSGADQPLVGAVDGMHRDGEVIPEGWLVMPHGSAVDNITTTDVQTIITRAIIAASETRAAIRPLGSTTNMVFCITDTSGEILGLYRMPDATVFSIDVAVAKARNVAYYSDATDLQPVDTVVTPGVAFTNRTFRFLSEARYPSGVDGTNPPPFSILNDPGINPATAENLGAAAAAGGFDSVLGNDAFRVMTNFRDPGDATVVAAGGAAQPTANQNGIIFFPGSTPLYVNGSLVGGFGVSGDGVDQDDVVTYNGAFQYLPNGVAVRADQVVFNDVRLPYIKFNRNPFAV